MTGTGDQPRRHPCTRHGSAQRRALDMMNQQVKRILDTEECIAIDDRVIVAAGEPTQVAHHAGNVTTGAKPLSPAPSSSTQAIDGSSAHRLNCVSISRNCGSRSSAFSWRGRLRVAIPICRSPAGSVRKRTGDSGVAGHRCGAGRKTASGKAVSKLSMPLRCLRRCHRRQLRRPEIARPALPYQVKARPDGAFPRRSTETFGDVDRPCGV